MMKNLKFKKIVDKLPTIIFNIAETCVIVLTGKLLQVNIVEMIIILLAFVLVRTQCPKPMHYKKWYHCIIWTTLVFLSLFVILKIDFKICVVMTCFVAYVLTGKGNINTIYMWKGRKSNYSDIDEYIKYNPYSEKLLEFEKKLEEQSALEFLIYKYRFKEHLTYSEMAEKLDLETPRLAEKIEKIGFAIRIFCKI